MITPAQAKEQSDKYNNRFPDVVGKQIDDCLVKDMNATRESSGKWAISLNWSTFSNERDQHWKDWSELLRYLQQSEFATEFDQSMRNLEKKYEGAGWKNFVIRREGVDYLHVNFTNPRLEQI